MENREIEEVRVYGFNHSPWVQAVLMGLYENDIDHSITSLPPLDTFARAGVMMPAASFDGGPWQLESADILANMGFRTVSPEELALVRQCWRGVAHRVDSVSTFWGSFSRSGDVSSNFLVRMIRNFLRAFITLYMFVLINFSRRFIMKPDPENFGDQFLELEERLKEHGFQKANSGLLVNIDYIEHMIPNGDGSYDLLLKVHKDKMITVSRSCSKAILSSLSV